ncbi:MAG: RagB/SusD family protein [Candidatus Parvibacillus calidus]|nr:MAG: RagB/SusD family protein [Candidatus Parvibacillus calidus]
MMKNINRLYQAGILVLSLILSTGCSKDFLEVPIQGQATPDSDPAIAEKLVTGVYNSMLAGSAFGGIGDVHGISFITATIIMTDDAEKGSTASDQPNIAAIDNFEHTSTNNFVAALWTGNYNAIAKANQALKALDVAPIADAIKTQYQGEVRFLRAYFYFNLVRYFGGVPKVLQIPADANEANSNPVYQTRASVDEIYSLIREDLNYAIEHLKPRSQSQVGRANKGAAQAMLAKVELTTRNWQNAYNLCQEVINSGQYSLLAKYEDIWRQVGDNSVESIFEVQTGQFNNSDFGVEGYCVWQGPRVGGKGGWRDLGFGFNNPTVDLVNEYEPGDIRKDATIIFIDNSGTHKGTILFDGYRIPSQDSVQNARYNYKAYHSENKEIESFFGNRDRKAKNIHLLRYGDLLLMAAESANELGNTGEAATYLNMIRERATLSATTASSQADMREAIYHERRVEMAMEHDRWFDLVRTGRAAKVMKPLKPSFTEGKNELLPIPALQIALSGGKLLQNPGY